jgi:hypothetical protein
MRGIGAFQQLHVREPEQIGHDGFAATVLIGAIGVQSVAAAACLDIDEGQGEIVAAQEPGKGPVGGGPPPRVTGDDERRAAGRDRRRCLEGLLVEGARGQANILETVAADRPE